MNILYCALDANEFNRICSCDTAKEIWDKLVVTYEGTSQVRETKVNMLIHEYELFKMEPNESIKDMYTRFIHIINNLKSLGKTYTNEEMVRKVLRCLPRKKWGPKVTAIEEAQDLTRLLLDDLLGKLLTHELSLKEEEDGKAPTTDSLALKAKGVQEVDSSNDDSDEDDDEDPFVLMARSFNKILKMRKYYKKGNSSKAYNNNKKGKKYSSGNSKNANFSCFGCGSIEHFMKDCSKTKKKERT